MESVSTRDHSHHGTVEKKERGAFYQDAAQYWSTVPPTVDGMLGGYGFISKVDIQGSNLFLKRLFRLKVPPGKGRVLDCGAGIGRITKHLFLHYFQKVDLVEQNPAFVAQARASLELHSNMGNFFCAGLQDFVPEAAAYDVIWCQWVLGHLKDDDLIAFLHGCIHGLKENGVLVIKENATSSGKIDEDPTDSSVTRPLDLLCILLQQAGLQCVKQKRQENFPSALYPVYMIATRPVKRVPKDDALNIRNSEMKSPGQSYPAPDSLVNSETDAVVNPTEEQKEILNSSLNALPSMLLQEKNEVSDTQETESPTITCVELEGNTQNVPSPSVLEFPNNAYEINVKSCI